jgi:Secretion system C-terminal sorting domain
VFPVPARNYVNYSFTSSVAGKAYITVTDISGRTLRTEAIQVVGGFNNMRLDLNGILPGVYILRMTGKDHSQIGKIIIE